MILTTIDIEPEDRPRVTSYPGPHNVWPGPNYKWLIIEFDGLILSFKTIEQIVELHEKIGDFLANEQKG